MNKSNLNLVVGKATLPFLRDVIDIDTVTLPPEYVTSYEMLKERFDTFSDSFIGMIDDNKLIGYFNFFPVQEKTMDSIIKGEIKNDIYLGKNDIYNRLYTE